VNRTVKKEPLGKTGKGVHNYIFKSDGLQPGLYFCSLYIDGVLIATQKLIKSE